MVKSPRSMFFKAYVINWLFVIVKSVKNVGLNANPMSLSTAGLIGSSCPAFWLFVLELVELVVVGLGLLALLTITGGGFVGSNMARPGIFSRFSFISFRGFCRLDFANFSVLKLDDFCAFSSLMPILDFLVMWVKKSFGCFSAMISFLVWTSNFTLCRPFSYELLLGSVWLLLLLELNSKTLEKELYYTNYKLI